ncbi:ATPase family associated with various cellular activities [Heracleum sosnowskyi]|uniref:ATPase family associated with various cellular activities n=1 Tax=Heracleum sosnowskyi TaxID=360622 RepID=A0AAD8NAB0_9APIA|nr:ATPase family associated with various cellular activities [Heracleum sosnowskyi]
MPSPPIPRSISAPDVFASNHSSNRSTNSAKGTSWLKKTSSLLTYTKKESELTEESLEALNKRNEALEDKKSSHSSPYYKGLTDFTLDIKKEKLPSAVSPAIDNHDGVSYTSSTRSSFIVTLQQLGTFCLFFRSKDEKECSSSSTSLSSKQQDIDLDKGKKEDKSSLVETKSNLVLNTDKPLKERVRFKYMTATSVLPETILSKTVASNVEELSRTVEGTYLFTWADKYRPHNLTEFICNREKAMELNTMAKSKDISHFIFEGFPGVGKHTMILAFLREIFGADEIEAKEECMEFYMKGEALSSIKVNVKRSSHHVELNISELRGYEKHVIVKLINEKYNKSSDSVYEAIVLSEADKLSIDALLYIKWILDKYNGRNKVFFCCNDVSKLQPIKTLCRVIKLLPPSNQEIMEVLDFIAKQEGIELAIKLAETITNNSKNNLRQAIRSFEATWRYNSNSQLREDQEIMTGWEDTIAKVARDIVKEQSPRQLFIIRGELQKLIEYNVSPVFIFKTLIGELKRHLDASSQTHVDILFMESKRRGDITDCIAFPNNRTEEMCKRENDPSRKNVHNFMKIEEFIAKFMSWYKVLLTNNKLQDMKMKGIVNDLDPTKGTKVK